MVNPPGETISHTAVIEYQRRGLPHIHFLGEHAHDLHFHDHVPPDVHVPAQAVVAADREGADGVNVADVAEQAWEGGTWGVEAKWRRQGGCRGGSVDGWGNGMCGIEAKSLEVEGAARGWSSRRGEWGRWSRPPNRESRVGRAVRGSTFHASTMRHLTCHLNFSQKGKFIPHTTHPALPHHNPPSLSTTC